MKALYFDGSGRLEWKDDPTPIIQAQTDALVRPIAVSTCDLDQAIVNGPEPLPGSEQPFAMGHEGVDAWRSIAPHLKRQPGGAVLIMSQGSIGLYACDIARAYGARRVRYVDPDPKRQQLARDFGAEASALDDFSPDECEYPISLVTHPDKASLHAALHATAPGGHCENRPNVFN